MSEVFPPAPKIPSSSVESDLAQFEEAKGVRTPEYWVARPELPFSKEYIGLQIKVAREVSQRLNVPLSKVVDDYAPVFHPYVWAGTENYLDIDTMSDEQLEEAIYEKERTHAETQPLIEYNDHHRYGCFAFMAHTGGTGEKLKGRVDIHFSNAEFAQKGPLDKENIEHRLSELKDLFTAVKKEFPDAKFVRGDSWLYNVEAYKRLFPESYVAHPEVDESLEALGTGRTWGQFADNHMQLKRELAEEFLKKIEELEEITPNTVRQALPFQALIVTAPIEDFYKKYGVT